MVEALREAITRKRLSLEFQPIVTAAGRPVGVEALIRWNHPTRGRVPPDTFLPLAEHAGLMPAVTRAVLEMSLDEACALRRRGWTVPVSMNLSASDLLDDSLVDIVAEALAERGLPGAALRIEITESLLVEGATAGDFLTRLRALGIDLAVDDYGTGYSSLAYLHDLPVSYLKIDRGFTDRLPQDGRTAIIVASTIEMAHRLDLRVVAEGVENDDQLDWLREFGCDLVQGYHIGRPVGAERLHTWLAERVPAGTPRIPAPHEPGLRSPEPDLQAREPGPTPEPDRPAAAGSRRPASHS
jgi:EAL domain-containing protein (putative c-di-GMP-specific phosphodiesterase class I)